VSLFLEQGARFARIFLTLLGVLFVPAVALAAAVAAAVAARKKSLVILVKLVLSTEKADLLRWRNFDLRFLNAGEQNKKKGQTHTHTHTHVSTARSDCRSGHAKLPRLLNHKDGELGSVSKC